MKLFTTLLTGISLLTGSYIFAAEALKPEVAKTGCHCTTCKCTPEKDCGCCSGKSCQCSTDSHCCSDCGK